MEKKAADALEVAEKKAEEREEKEKAQKGALIFSFLLQVFVYFLW